MPKHYCYISPCVSLLPKTNKKHYKTMKHTTRARGIPVESVGRHYVLISVPRRGLLKKTKIQADCARLIWHYLW